jgi:phage terminase small subunit
MTTKAERNRLTQEQRAAVGGKIKTPLKTKAVGPKGNALRELDFLEKCFVRRYIATRDPAKAAKAAGFREGECDLRAEGLRLAQTHHIAMAIASEQKEILASLKVDATSILAELSKIAFTNMRDFLDVAEDNKTLVLDLTDVPYERFAAITEYTVDERTSERFDKEGNVVSSITTRKPKIKMGEKRQALMDLARIEGMLVEEEKDLGSIKIVVTGGLPERDTSDVRPAESDAAD